MAKINTTMGPDVCKDLPLMKEWKVSRYFRKTVAQLHDEFRNDAERVIGMPNPSHATVGNGLGSIPGNIYMIFYISIPKAIILLYICI